MSKSYRTLPFANYLQLPTIVSRRAWRVLRVLSVLTALTIAALLIARPDLGMPVFWGLVIPSLPVTFMIAPGFWRNVCPLATSNQAPRRHGIARGLTNQRLSEGAAYPMGITLLISAVVARKLLFNQSGVATAALLLGAMGFAFAGGVFFKGKSGWCSSICPLLPVQRLYGQTPFVRIANTQCEPCVGCAKNCYDFSPGAAYLADQYDNDPAYRNFRRLFAALFPGLVLGYYQVPPLGEIGAWSVIGGMLMYMAGSMAIFSALDLVIGKTRNGTPVVFGAAAFSLYYWFSAPLVAKTVDQLSGLIVDRQVVGGVRTLAICCGLIWIARSLNLERAFLRDQLRKGKAGDVRLAPIVIETVRLNRKAIIPIVPERPATLDGIAISQPVPFDDAPVVRPVAAAVAMGDGPAELRIEPSGQTASLRAGQTLLDVLEGCNAQIQSGCRAGACGADPVAVTVGGERLNPIGADERATLQRLGCSGNTRLACMARVRHPGPISVELKPQRQRSDADERVASAPPAEFDRSIRRVVVIGNGVAGLTAADHLRRHHPECEIHLIGRENHSAYNRMAIAKLISTPTGVHGLQLLPHEWYAEHRITPWLNTHVTDIDRAGRVVTLATRETLSYDRLILATGSSARVPPLEGFGVDGCFVLRDADDAMAIRDHLQRHGGASAVVLGAGLLGLEAAQALSQLGAEVKILSKTDQLLDRQIDVTASHLLATHLATKGIEVVTDAVVASVEANDRKRVEAILLRGDQRLKADAFVVCTGASPNVELARTAGLPLGHGIKVDARMATNDPCIFAAGDTAEYAGVTHGLWAVAMEQGEVAALNALGIERRYREHVPVTALKVSGIDVRSAGLVHASSANDTEFVQYLPDAGMYRKLVVSGDRKVVGAVLVGAEQSAEEIVAAVREKAALTTLQGILEDGRWQPRKRAIAA